MATFSAKEIPSTGIGWRCIRCSSSIVRPKSCFFNHGVQAMTWSYFTLYPGGSTGLMVVITYSAKALTGQDRPPNNSPSAMEASSVQNCRMVTIQIHASELKGYFVSVCVRLLRRMYLSMYWESFTHLQLMRGWNR